MDEVAEYTGRKYKLFEWYGPKDAEYAIVLIGSSTYTCQEVVDHYMKNNK